MFKILKSAFDILKIAMLGSFLALSCYILTNAAIIEDAYIEKYENAYEQMIREHEQNIAFGGMLRSQRSWERSNEVIGIAYKDERAARNKVETELQIQMYEMYTFYRVLERLHPGAVKEVEDQLGPYPRFYPAPGFPDVDNILNPIELQLTPEGFHAN